MKCSISEESLKALVKIVDLELLQNENYTFQGVMTSVYELVKNATGDHAQALDYAKYVPYIMVGRLSEVDKFKDFLAYMGQNPQTLGDMVTLNFNISKETTTDEEALKITESVLGLTSPEEDPNQDPPKKIYGKVPVFTKLKYNDDGTSVISIENIESKSSSEIANVIGETTKEKAKVEEELKQLNDIDALFNNEKAAEIYNALKNKTFLITDVKDQLDIDVKDVVNKNSKVKSKEASSTVKEALDLIFEMAGDESIDPVNILKEYLASTALKFKKVNASQKALLEKGLSRLNDNILHLNTAFENAKLKEAKKPSAPTKNNNNSIVSGNHNSLYATFGYGYDFTIKSNNEKGNVQNDGYKMPFTDAASVHNAQIIRTLSTISEDANLIEGVGNAELVLKAYTKEQIEKDESLKELNESLNNDPAYKIALESNTFEDHLIMVYSLYVEESSEVEAAKLKVNGLTEVNGQFTGTSLEYNPSEGKFGYTIVRIPSDKFSAHNVNALLKSSNEGLTKEQAEEIIYSQKKELLDLKNNLNKNDGTSHLFKIKNPTQGMITLKENKSEAEFYFNSEFLEKNSKGQSPILTFENVRFTKKDGSFVEPLMPHVGLPGENIRLVLDAGIINKGSDLTSEAKEYFNKFKAFLNNPDITASEKIEYLKTFFNKAELQKLVGETVNYKSPITEKTITKLAEKANLFTTASDKAPFNLYFKITKGKTVNATFAFVKPDGQRTSQTFLEALANIPNLKIDNYGKAQLSGDGVIRRLNPTLSFEKGPVIKGDAVNSSENKVVKDDPDLDLFGGSEPSGGFNPNYFDKLESIKSLNKDVTQEQLDAAQEWYDKSIFKGVIPLTLLFDMVNSDNPKSIATFSQSGITLYAGSDLTDLYHESFHAFTQGFMTLKQKSELYAELRNKKGYFKDYNGELENFSTASDLQLEEYLAEEFRTYMIKNQKGVSKKTSPKQLNFFQRLFKALQALFGKSTKAESLFSHNDKVMNDLFNKIRVGDVSGYKYDKNNMSYPTLNKGIIAVKEDGTKDAEFVSYKDSNTVNALIDSYLIEFVEIGSYGFKSQAEYDKYMAYQKLKRKIALNKYSNSLKDIKERADDKSNAEKLNVYYNSLPRDYSKAKKLSNDVDYATRGYTHAYNRLKSLGLEYRQELNVLSESLSKAPDSKKPLIQGDINSVKTKLDLLIFTVVNYGNLDNLADNLANDNESVAGVISYHLEHSKMFKTDFVLDTNEMDESDQLTKSMRALDRSGNDVSFQDSIGNEVAYIMSTLPKYKLVKTIHEPVYNEFGLPEFETFGTVVNNLARLLEGDVMTDSMYASLLKNQEKTPYIKELLQRLGEYNADMSDEAYSLWSNLWQGMNKALVQLVQVTTTQTSATEDNEGNVIPASEETTAGVTARDYDAIGLLWDNDFRQGVIDINKEVKDILYGEDEHGFFLKISSAIDYFKKSENDPKKNSLLFFKALGFNLSDVKDVEEALKDGNKYSTDFVIKTLKALKAQDITEVRSINALVKGVEGVGGADMNSTFTNLKKLQSRYSDRISPFLVLNAEGNAQYEHTLNNSITVFATLVNDPKIKNYDELINNPELRHLDMSLNHNAKASIWLNKIFDFGDGGKRRIGSDGNIVTIKINNLSGIAFINDDVKNASKLASADTFSKQVADLHLSAFGFYEFMRHADKGSSYSGSLSEKFDYVTVESLKSGSAKDKAYDMVKPYIIAEIQRIITLKSYDKRGVEDYDFEYIKRGSDFVTFDDLLINTKSDLIAEIEKVVSEESLKDVSIESLTDTAYNKALEIYEGFDKVRIREDFNKYFENQINFNNNLYSKEGANFISKTVEKRFKKPGDVKADTIKRLVDFYTYNSFIHNLETVTFFYGDMAMYNHKKEDFHKRNAANGSTGTLYAWDDVTLSKINSPEFYKHSYAYSKQQDLKMTTANVWGKQLNTAIMDEMVIDSIYKDSMPKSAQEAYLGQEEGDAQALITFDAYRNLKFSEGTWGPKQEALYRKIVKGEDVSNEDALKYFPVIKAQYSGTLDTGSMLPLQALHKYSLFPLIPSVIKNKQAEILHDKMVKENISYVTFKSGSKVGRISKDGKNDKVYSDQKSRTFNSELSVDGLKVNVDTEDQYGNYKPFFTPNIINIPYLKNQLSINDKDKGSVVFATQLRKLVIDGLTEGGIPIDYEVGSANREQLWSKLETEDAKLKASPAYALKKVYQNNLTNLTNWNKQKLLREIGWDNKIVNGKVSYVIGNMQPLIEMLKTELNTTNGSHIADNIQVLQGGLEMDLSLSLSADKIEGILNSLMNNRLVKQKVKGEALIQLASTFFNDLAPTGSFRNATAEELEKHGQALPFYKPNGKGPTSAMKVKVAFRGDFKKLITLKDLNGEGIAVYKTVDKKRVLDQKTTVEKLNSLLKNEEWLNTGDHRKMITMIGVRIPVQGLNSMEFMEVYEFLPAESGGVIIPPTEIVTKSGGDFDVDKLTVMMPTIDLIGGTAEYAGSNPVEAKGETEISLKEKLKVLNKDRREVQEYYKEFFEEQLFLDSLTEEDLLNFLSLNKDIRDNYDAIGKEIEDKKNKKTKSDRLSNQKKIDALIKKQNSLVNDRAINYLPKLDLIKNNAKADKKKELETLNAEIIKVQRQISTLGKGGIENSLIGNMREMLSLPSNFEALVTPNSTDLFSNDSGTGIADRMENHNPENNAVYKKMNGQSGFSSTMTLTWGYNLHKQKVNSIGMQALGLGAIDNTYNVLLTSLGFYLNENKKVSLKTKNPGLNRLISKVKKNHKLKVDKDGKTDLKRTILLKHNKKNKGVSLSELKDSHGQNSISDVINQLINGWVDIAKKAWVFDAQANKEVTPVLLYLIQAGVHLDEAVYLVSNPLVKKYIKNKDKAKSIFAKNFKDDWVDQTKYKSNALLKTVNDIPNLKDYNFENASDVKKFADIALINHSNLSSEKLKDHAEGRGLDERFDISVLLHYIQLEDAAQIINNIKTATNVDTAKPRTYFERVERQNALIRLKSSTDVDFNLIKSLEKDSPISSFFNFDFVSDVYEKLFNFRTDSFLNDEMSYFLKGSDGEPGITTLYFNNDKAHASNTYKNELLSYMFQNELKHFDISKLKSYKSYDIESSVEHAYLFKNGAAYDKNSGKLFIDKGALKKLYTGYSKNFKNLENVKFSNEQEFYKYMLETAIIREQLPFSAVKNTKKFKEILERASYKKEGSRYSKDLEVTDADRKKAEHVFKNAYENYVRDVALANVYNYHNMFESSTNSFSKEFGAFKRNYNDKLSDFKFTRLFISPRARNKVRGGNIQNIILADTKPTPELINEIHEELKLFKDPAQVAEKLNLNLIKDKVEINDVVSLFKRFDVFAIMQGGFNTSGKYSLNRFVDQAGVIKLLGTPSKELLTSQYTKEYLSFFHDVFKNKLGNVRTRYNSVDYNNNYSIVKGDPYNIKLGKHLFTEDVYFEIFNFNKANVKITKDVSSEQPYYEGNITPGPNTVFVFGSNPLGINGNPSKGTGGAALVAHTQFGVKQGEKMDNKLSDSGNAFGLTTVTGPGKKRSVTPEKITESIKSLYEVAKANPNKQFKVAYRNTTETSLNGYTGLEMIEMFNDAAYTELLDENGEVQQFFNIPSNVIFSKEWFNTGLLQIQKKRSVTEGKYENIFTNRLILKNNVKNDNVYEYAKASSNIQYLGEVFENKILDNGLFSKGDLQNLNVLELGVDNFDGETHSVNEKVKQSIDNFIDKMVGDLNQGDMLALYGRGYGQKLINQKKIVEGKTVNFHPGLETFKYLSEQLFNNFGYINPHYTSLSDNVVSKSQDIQDNQVTEEKERGVLKELNDEMLDALINKC